MSTPTPRRTYGTGSLEIRKDKHGRETYYARFYAGTRQVRRKIGPKCQPGRAHGLTKPGAERAMQKLIDQQVRLVPVAERVNLQTAGERYIQHLAEVMRRKPSTVQDYEIMLRKHLVPFFGARTLDRIDTSLVGEYLLAKQRDGLASKTVGNQLTFLHGLFRHAMKRSWVYANPVAAVDRPRDAETDADIRFLTHEEVEALLRAVPGDGPFVVIDHPLCLTAITTGLRQGELVALRRDVDWSSGVIRVRVSYSRGEWGTPKSRRSSRAVPLIDRTAAALDERCRKTAFRGDDDLVFGHPVLGTVLDTSKLRKRFKETLTKAGVREVRFHDLRHTFGTQAAAAGVPPRTLQEWMEHRDYKTTLIYADYAPRTHEKSLMERAFSPAPPRFPEDTHRWDAQREEPPEKPLG